MNRIFTITLLFTLLALPVIAQEIPANDPIPACSQSELATLNTYALELRELLADISNNDTIDAVDALQTRFWSEYAPRFPQCALAQSMLLYYARSLDELLIYAAFNTSNRGALYGHHLVSSFASSDIARQARETFLASIADNADGSENTPQPSGALFSASGTTSDAIGPLELGEGTFIVEIEYTLAHTGRVTIEFKSMDSRAGGLLLTGVQTAAGRFTDRFSIELLNEPYMMDVRPSGAATWTITINKVE